MRYPNDVKDRVREATDILAVVSEHVRLKKAGRSMKGLCPFHQEKTPSFQVNPDRQTFKCFGCGQGGDVFQFLMEVEKLSFPEALELLAAKAGIALPKAGWTTAEEQSVFPVLEWAATHYRQELAGRTGGPAREYLEGRGILPATAERFGLGWAPPGWSNLLAAAERRYSQAMLLRAGLVIEGDRGGVYDRFRNRLVIPIRSALGRAVGFGARTLGGEDPKYLNSPETEVFNKSKVLYGLSEARESLKTLDEALVVEGYMDTIALAQAGFPQVVASCGTAFTENQAALLRRYVERAVLIFDGDAAGIRAAWKSAGVFLGAGLGVRIVGLPEGHDPDSFVRERGRDALALLAERAPGVVGFAHDVLLDRVERREDLIKAFAILGAKVDDPIRRRVLLQEAAERFRFDEDTLAREAGRLRGADAAKRPAPDPARETPVEPKDPLGRAYLGVLLSDAGGIPEDALVEEGALRERGLRELYGRWRAVRESGEDRPGSRLLEDPELRFLASELLTGEAPAEALPEILERLQARVRSDHGRALREAIQAAETHGDRAEVERLLRELHVLKDAS